MRRSRRARARAAGRGTPRAAHGVRLRTVVRSGVPSSRGFGAAAAAPWLLSCGWWLAVPCWSGRVRGRRGLHASGRARRRPDAPASAAGAVPLAIVAGHVLAQLPDVARRRLPPRRPFMGVADSWFCLAPAVVVGIAGVPERSAAPGRRWPSPRRGQFALDFVVSAPAARVGLGTGFPIRSLMRPFAWVWAVDLLLLPVGLLIAVVALDPPPRWPRRAAARRAAGRVRARAHRPDR